MKAIIFFAALIMLSLIYSCNSPATATSSGSATTDSMKLLDEQVYKGFVSGDFSAFEKMTSPDIVDHGIGDKDVVGKDSVEKYLKEMNTQIKDLKFDVLSESADSNYSMTLVRMTGVSNDAKTGMPVGTQMDMTSVDVLKWKDGKVTEHWNYMDPRDMMKMMASMPHTATADSTMHK